jgi:hypothetical protein
MPVLASVNYCPCVVVLRFGRINSAYGKPARALESLASGDRSAVFGAGNRESSAVGNGSRKPGLGSAMRVAR